MSMYGSHIECEDCGNRYEFTRKRWAGTHRCEGCGSDAYWRRHGPRIPVYDENGSRIALFDEDPKPKDWTDEQFQAVVKLYTGNPDGSSDLAEFLKRCRRDYVIGTVFIQYCRMLVGIEKDGYTHT